MPAPVVKLPTVGAVIPERGSVVGDRLRPPAGGLVGQASIAQDGGILIEFQRPAETGDR